MTPGAKARQERAFQERLLRFMAKAAEALGFDLDEEVEGVKAIDSTAKAAAPVQPVKPVQPSQQPKAAPVQPPTPTGK